MTSALDEFDLDVRLGTVDSERASQPPLLSVGLCRTDDDVCATTTISRLPVKAQP